jgi:hypothetical protein
MCGHPSILPRDLGRPERMAAYVDGVRGIGRIVQRVDVRNVAGEGGDVCVR